MEKCIVFMFLILASLCMIVFLSIVMFKLFVMLAAEQMRELILIEIANSNEKEKEKQ